MKDFWKNVLATIVGMMIVSVLFFFILISSLASLSLSNPTAKAEDNSVLTLMLSGQVVECSEENPFTMLTGQISESIGLNDIISAIKKAKADKNIKGIYLEAGLFAADSPASSHAIREALLDFKASGKWIVAYADTYTQNTYYICSVADKVMLNPHGSIDWHGLAAQPYFVKDLLAKFGVKFQLSKVGKYKSAPETMTADKMSDPNREQVSAYINGIWQVMLADVAKSRKISVDSLNSFADHFTAFDEPSALKQKKLVDELMYTNEVKDVIKKLLKTDKPIHQLTVSDMVNMPSADDDGGDKIAVYYAYGDIVDSETGDIMQQTHNIVATTVCKDLEELTNDDDVKAVVLRVNSPGGSAYASEQIWHAVTQLKAKKPVVVSMGGYAASGGYYISCASNYIIAEPTTITGSIGIFGMFPDFSGLLTDKLGVKFDEVKTNRHAAFGTPARPFNAEEMAMIDSYIDRGYKLFRQRVADGRKLPVDKVEEIAQGRVWLGNDALKIKLVDAIGSLDDAVKKAAELAKSKEYHTAAYPEPADWMEQLMNTANRGSYLDEEMHAALGEYYEPLRFVKTISQRSAIQARLPYFVTIK